MKTRRVNLIQESLLMLREVLSIWWARFRGKYRRTGAYADSHNPDGPPSSS